jgi:hypothetical protein
MTIVTRAAVAAGVFVAFWLGVWAAPLMHEMETSTRAGSSEIVLNHVAPLLGSGTDARTAAEGFTSAEQFVAVAHASQSTDVPFVLLKQRVLNENQTLAEAIRSLKPELDAAREAALARRKAQADLSRIAN